MRRIIWLFLLLCFALPIMAQDTPAPDPQSLEEIYYGIIAIDNLEARGILESDNAEAQRTYYLIKAEQLTGHSWTLIELERRVGDTSLQRWLRVLSFVNIIWLLASLMIVLAVGFIFTKYILPILIAIPVIIYEVLLYSACFAFIYVAYRYFTPDIGQYVAMPGILGLVPLMPWSYVRRVQKRNESREKTVVNVFWDDRVPLIMQYSILTVIWGASAIVFESQLIGFFAVSAILVVLTASGIPEQLHKILRLEKHNYAPVVLLISGFVLALYIMGEIFAWLGYYRYFSEAVYATGTYVYFSSLAVLASRWYTRKGNEGRYWLWQVVAVISGVAALFIGTVWEIYRLQQVGGTFLLILLLEKYIELFNWKRAWVWAMLGLGILLYGVALVINQYPQYFLFS